MAQTQRLALTLYDSLAHKELEFQPTEGAVIRLYSCGPTVYDYAHIGNLRSFIMADILYRTLKMDGLSVQWVMNITDVDDKTIRKTTEKHGPNATVEQLRAVCDIYLDAFYKDLESVNVSRADIRFERVTDHIPEIQNMVTELIDKGYAYQADDGSIYFNIETYQKDFGDYGDLVGEHFLKGKKIGARVSSDEYDKNNLSDFALWKAHTPLDGNIFWEHPKLGKGRPGWHIECSAINKIAFGQKTTDIHTGGVDLIFPHHTNEIAQSQPFYKPFARHWFHSEHLLVDGQKMAKSVPQTNITLRTIEDHDGGKCTGLDFRYLVLGASYASKLSFNWETLVGARTARLKIIKRFGELSSEHAPSDETHKTEILNALNDNLNTAAALGHLHQALDAGASQNLILWADHALGLDIYRQHQALTDIPSSVRELAQKREDARKAKAWSEADTLRKELENQGWGVEDTPSGPVIHKI